MTSTNFQEGADHDSVSEFPPEMTADANLPMAIKHILGVLAERKAIPEMTMSQREVKELCGYSPRFYSQENSIPEQLTQAVSKWGYEAREVTGQEMDIDRLKAILDNEDASLPIVELDPDYFHDVEDSRVQDIVHRPSHTVIVQQITDGEILYYDPIEIFFENSSRIDETASTCQITKFDELWSGRYQERWTLWVDRSEQPPLEQFG